MSHPLQERVAVALVALGLVECRADPLRGAVRLRRDAAFGALDEVDCVLNDTPGGW